MTNQARDKAIKSLNYVEGTTLRKKANTYANILRAIDIALQEQAKEIKEMLEKYEKELLWVKAKNLLIFSDDWDKFWEKYGVK